VFFDKFTEILILTQILTKYISSPQKSICTFDYYFHFIYQKKS